VSAIDERRARALAAADDARTISDYEPIAEAGIKVATQVTEAQLVGMSDALSVARGEGGASYGVEAGLRHVLGLLGFEVVP
jgi:hypothetical protein